MAGNANSGRRQEKPFATALRMEAILLEKGEETPAPVGSLRWNARQLLKNGEVAAIKELADRLDGKSVQQMDIDANITTHEDWIGKLSSKPRE